MLYNSTIMHSTPSEIAKYNSAKEISEAFYDYTPFESIEETGDRLFGKSDPAETADITAAQIVPRCEQLLVEWYDECDEDRPCTAEELAKTYSLYTALYLRWQIDDEEDEEIKRWVDDHKPFTWSEFYGLPSGVQDGVLKFWEHGYNYSNPDFWRSYEKIDMEHIHATQMYDWLITYVGEPD